MPYEKDDDAMIRSDLCRYVVTLCVTAVMLAGCAVRENTAALPMAMQQTARAQQAGHAQRFRVVYQFAHRAFPDRGLIYVKGALYGTTPVGGGPGHGIVYSVTTDGVWTNLYAFKGNSDGALPESGLIDVNGTLYGTTKFGGGACRRGGCGTVYSVTTNGAERVLHSFAGGADGAYPEAGLVNVNGTLYGTTYEGGSGSCSIHGRGAGCGTVFSISTSGGERVLYSFSGGSDGWYPASALTDVNGVLYGTTFFGGTDAEGTVFRITTTGKKKVLHSFGAGADGSNPEAPVFDVNGTLYGTTLRGGTSDEGTVFSLRANGPERVLHSFSGDDGDGPQGRLIDFKSEIYGTTATGGSANDGIVYGISTAGKETVVHSFTGKTNGGNPHDGLTDIKGTLYGTTAGGGSGHGFGIVYALSP